MARLDPISSEQFDTIRRAHLELLRINLQELRKYARAGDAAKVAALKRARADLSKAAGTILQAQRAYQATHLSPSAAEQRVRAHAAQAEDLVRRIGSLTDVLESVAKFASVLTRLVGALS
ncbi:hypothetical protein [Rhodovulum marinum]|uniref:Uncharacterized protein n=1 Tax=Rhodovulum marinum TaxID=320662 RepID=A0A4V2SRD7_9RHOB|nr:hypothetical protein [Rhodovulum marinum]TCP42106.1 hypothetical protein EV662_10311 [Rhodovulum marinum]